MSVSCAKLLAIAPLVLVLVACGGDEGAVVTAPSVSFCAGKTFTAPALSPYRLPYAAGTGYTMSQGNCSPNPALGHHESFAYDFDLPLFTPVLAMRGGRVLWEHDRYSNDDHTPGHENAVWILHDDGTITQYGHLSPGGNTVIVNQVVMQGDVLGSSGNSGNSFAPHLHVWVYADGLDFTKSNTVPQTFSNANGTTQPTGELILGVVYTALP